jgi:mannitol-1-phosphate 5-dehydrogenase
MKESTKKLVIFGAGKIGRSFIGQVFSRSGYEVVLVDINHELIRLLNKEKCYRVIIKSSTVNETLVIQNIRGVHLGEEDEVVAELADASLAAVSVGQQGLPAALPLMARSLLTRRLQYGEWPLDIIIAENMRNADAYVSAELKKSLPADYPLDTLVGLVETSIGKMVPIMTHKDLEEDPLQVFAEPYNTLIVSKKGFKNPVPVVADLAPKDNIKAWVDRKLFIHNLGHATAAYLGYGKNPAWVYLAEALQDLEIQHLTRQTMLQSADILRALYPGEFTSTQLEEHIDDLLTRFQNKALGDTIFRVGCDLYRKLSPEDRLVAPIRAAVKFNKPYDLIVNALKYAISFRATDENGKFYPADEQFFREAEKGVDHVISQICRLRGIAV